MPNLTCGAAVPDLTIDILTCEGYSPIIYRYRSVNITTTLAAYAWNALAVAIAAVFQDDQPLVDKTDREYARGKSVEATEGLLQR